MTTITHVSRANLSITLTPEGLRQAAEQVVAIPDDAQVVSVEMEEDYNLASSVAATWLAVTFEWKRAEQSRLTEPVRNPRMGLRTPDEDSAFQAREDW